MSSEPPGPFGSTPPPLPPPLPPAAASPSLPPPGSGTVPKRPRWVIPVIAAAAGLVVLVPVAAILAGMLVPAFARARTRAEQVRCESQVGALGNLLLVEMGERGKEGGDPVPWTVVTNVATVPALYRCPGDRRRPEPGDLAGAVEGSSYEFLPDDLVRMPGGRVLVYCPIHGHGVLEDGSVHKLRSPAGDAGR